MTIEDTTFLVDPAHDFNLETQSIRWTHIIVHHTGAEEQDAEQVRRHHIRKGWRDVGYHFLIERNGRLVDGRPLTWPGAHTSADNMNQRGIGICLIGNFERRNPTLAQLNTLRDLLVRLMIQFGIPVTNILGHGEVFGAATKCPGKHFDKQNLVPLRLEVQGKLVPARIRLTSGGASEILLSHPNVWVRIAPLVQTLGGSVWWSQNTRTVHITFSKKV